VLTTGLNHKTPGLPLRGALVDPAASPVSRLAYNERPAWLDLAHKKLDAAVAAAYGWPTDLSDEQILERLLALNLERAAEEAKAQELPKRKSAQRDKAEHELI
jgi:hypothetical protein